VKILTYLKKIISIKIKAVSVFSFHSKLFVVEQKIQAGQKLRNNFIQSSLITKVPLLYMSLKAPHKKTYSQLFYSAWRFFFL